MRSESNLSSRRDNQQNNNNKLEGPSDSNYARIKDQDKTRTKHIRSRIQSLERKVKLQELTDVQDYFRSLSEDSTRLSTPDRASPALLLLNRNLYKWGTTKWLWCVDFHHEVVFIGVNLTSTDLERLVWHQVEDGRPSRVVGRVERPSSTFSTDSAFSSLCTCVATKARAKLPQTLAGQPRSWTDRPAPRPT
jgi:hypothetical protein